MIVWLDITSDSDRRKGISRQIPIQYLDDDEEQPDEILLGEEWVDES